MFRLEFDPPQATPRLATVVIDKEGESVNTVSPPDLDQIEAIFDAIEAERDIAGVIIISGKANGFVAGANVETFALATDRREIEAFARRGHAALCRIAASPRPVVAAIHGAALGAGLELTLVCGYRVCTDSPRTILGLPEVQLGLFPGGGGISRLPRLIGVREALDMVLTGRNVRPRKARKLGLVDEVVPSESLVAAARRAAYRLSRGEVSPRRGPRDDVARLVLEANPLGRFLLFKEARKSVDRKTLGLYPAPYVAIDLMEQGLRGSLRDALDREPPAFAELAVGEVSRSLVRLFRGSSALKREDVRVRKGGRPIVGHDVERLGLLGGGFMGADIAVVAANSGIEARIRDIDAGALGKAMSHANQFFDRRAKRGGERHVFKARARVSGGLTLDGFSTMDLVIEAVPEVLALKQSVFAELEQVTSEACILASNTSALPISAIAERVGRKDRVVGLHFFSPVPKMPLLEVVRTDETSPATLATALEFAARIGKTPVVVHDGPGFYTTRVLGFYLMAAIELLVRGHSIEEVDRGARLVGWPVGPLALLDEVGIDVGAKVARTLADHFGDRISVADGVDAFLADGRLGRKSRRGFYLYPEEGKKRPDLSVYDFFPGRASSPPRVNPDELGERLTLIAALEAVRCLEEEVIASPRDGDVAAVFGFGYPPLRGGPFRHLDQRGTRAALTRIEMFETRHGSAFSVPDLLRELAASGGEFESLEAR